MSSGPLVSCIMPTYNRRSFIPLAIKYFLRQDYACKELIILDDGSDPVKDLVPEHPSIYYEHLPEKITLGEKLNRAAEKSGGEIILQWDDDDWYAGNRITYQVKTLLDSRKDICGINQLYYYNLISREAFKYSYPKNLKPWLLGSSLCFRRELWKHHKFVHTNIGMDGRFVWGVSPEQIEVLEDYSFAVHMIHKHNVCPKRTSGNWWHHFPKDEIAKIMGEDWNLYGNDGEEFHVSDIGPSVKPALNGVKAEPEKTVKNIFACLVHEKIDCITDLVQNLHYHDPDSLILLYNGGQDKVLLERNSFFYQKFNAVIHPAPVRQKHGYLHGFALDCMHFALNNYAFDTLTIVDSDQLFVRQGYSKYLGSALLESVCNPGLLSSDAQRVLPDNKTNHIALQAHKEFPLWKHFLNKFPKGEDQFVYWTFWPSTVFFHDAVMDLINLFDRDRELQSIIARSRIWATEEIFFPTLIKLLGYDILANPCSYEYVNYRKSYSANDLRMALKKKEVFWIHPVPREYDNLIRKNIRVMNNHYSNHKLNGKSNGSMIQGPVPLRQNKFIQNGFFSFTDLLKRVNAIEGWLSNNEAESLITITIKACIELPHANSIVEIGSFQGKSTVLLGNLAKIFKPDSTVYAVEPHNGIVGAEDQKLLNLPPTCEAFNQNIEREGLAGNVSQIMDYSVNVTWDQPIALLYIDGLHDYDNVSKDFHHFESFIEEGGYIAFHDYADYFPGVMKFVDELSDSKKYQFVSLVDSLIILQKESKDN